MKNNLLTSLVLIFLLVLCSSCGPQTRDLAIVQDQAQPESRAALTVPEDSGTEPSDALEEAADQGVIYIQVNPEGPSKRVVWVSSLPVGPNLQICLEKQTVTIICSDAEEGNISGSFDVFSSMPVEGSTAAFRPRPD